MTIYLDSLGPSLETLTNICNQHYHLIWTWKALTHNKPLQLFSLAPQQDVCWYSSDLNNSDSHVGTNNKQLFILLSLRSNTDKHEFIQGALNQFNTKLFKRLPHNTNYFLQKHCFWPKGRAASRPGHSWLRLPPHLANFLDTFQLETWNFFLTILSHLANFYDTIPLENFLKASPTNQKSQSVNKDLRGIC